MCGGETKENICLPGDEGKCAAPCQDHRGEDARSDPAGAPQSLLLHIAHVLQRPERTFNHMAETHAQNEENKRGRGWHRGREGQAQPKAEKVGESERVKNRGHLRWVGEGQVSGERGEGGEGEREGDVGRQLLFLEQKLEKESSLTEEEHHYSLGWKPPLTQLVK